MDYLKFLSHRHSKLIFRSPNAISVYQRKSYRWILFNHKFIQTMIHVQKPHKIVLPYLHSLLIFAQEYPGPVLLLGLGGGAAVHILNRQHPLTPITVVEKHQEMIVLAKKFFFLPQTSNLEIVCADASHYIYNCNQKFKHILIDLGDESGFPKSCMAPDFFQKASHMLTHDGILCLNISNSKDIDIFKIIFKNLFQREPLIIYADGNWIICHSQQGQNYLLQQLKQGNYLKTHVWRPSHGAYLTLRSRKIAAFICFAKKILGYPQH